MTKPPEGVSIRKTGEMTHIKITKKSGAVVKVTVYENRTRKPAPRTNESTEQKIRQNKLYRIQSVAEIIDCNFSWENDCLVTMTFMNESIEKIDQEVMAQHSEFAFKFTDSFFEYRANACYELIAKFFRRRTFEAVHDHRFLYVVADKNSYGERTRLHCHAVVNRETAEWIRRKWKHGFVKIEPLEKQYSYYSLARYLINQAADLCSSYHRGRGLQNPVITRELCGEGTPADPGPGYVPIYTAEPNPFHVSSSKSVEKTVYDTVFGTTEEWIPSEFSEDVEGLLEEVSATASEEKSAALSCVSVEFDGIIVPVGYKNAYGDFSSYEIHPACMRCLSETGLKLEPPFVLSGALPEYPVYSMLHIKGKVIGSKITIDSYSPAILPAALEKAFIINSLPGVDVATVDRIIKLHGDDLPAFFAKQETFQEIRREVPKINITDAVELIGLYRCSSLLRDVYIFLGSFGADWECVKSIYQKYRKESMKKILEAPYDLLLDTNLPFPVCDFIAESIGICADDPARICATAQYVLRKYKKAGDLCISIDRLGIDTCSFAEKIPVFPPFCTGLISDIVSERSDIFTVDFFGKGAYVYLRQLYQAEVITAEQAVRIMRQAISLPFDPEVITKSESAAGVCYSSDQEACFDLLRHSGIAVITGGPGTGKTTVIQGLIDAYRQLNPTAAITLCASTGRAAQRMMESTGVKAVTIHSLLGLKPDSAFNSDEFVCNSINADLIVIDEASMLDVELACILFSAVKPGALLLIIGDVDQLPPVGPGNVLSALITCGIVPVFSLTATHRQGAGSLILENARRIHEGMEELQEGQEFLCRRCETAGQVRSALIAATVKLWNPEKPFDMQVLLPVHRGEAGIMEINTDLQSLLNPHRADIQELKYNNVTFRTGDKVMFLQNNYNLKYYNGDFGRIESITGTGVVILVRGNTITLPFSCMSHLSLAYAVSIHKSQGSEFKHCVIGLPKQTSYSMLNRNLFYTAVTRARESVFIAFEDNAMETAIRVPARERVTNLTQRIKNSFMSE